MRNILMLMSFSCASLSIFAQLIPNPPPVIGYGYDQAGNRISRQVIFVNAKMTHANDSTIDPIIKEEQLDTPPEDEQQESSAIESTLDDAKVKIYPNPVSETLNISIGNFSSGHNAEIAVYDMSGKLLQRQSNSARYAPISFLNYSVGTYVLKITVNNENKEWLIVKK